MRSLVLAALCLLSASSVLADELPPPRGAVVPAGATLEWLFTRQVKLEGGLTEGPAVAPDGSIYFSDILRGTDKGMIHRFDPATMKTTVFAADSGKSNGLIFNSAGQLLACEGADYGGRRLVRWNVKTGKRVALADRYRGARFNALNDLCLDLRGRIYFTDPRYLGHETRELEHNAVYRVDADGKNLIEVTHHLTKPNGIAISPDQKTLYVANHDNGTDNIDPTKPAPKQGVMTIYAFPLGPDGKVTGKRKTLYNFGEEKGCDGMTVDVQGNIYLTVRSRKRPGVLVVDPKGNEVAHIPTGPKNQSSDAAPTGLPSNVEFGIGKDANLLYVTVDTSLYRIRLKVKGFHHQYR